MQSSNDVVFDTSRHTATVNGELLPLQEKAWQVLFLLTSRAPNIVSRNALIEEIWAGNFLTGEKGLNQSLWSIRSVLGDDARNPTFIRTLPRMGYQWIYRSTQSPSPRSNFNGLAALAAGIVAVVIGLVAISGGENDAYAPPALCEPIDKSNVQAYRVAGDVFIDFQNGCRLIVKPTGTKRFGSPLVSDDGKHVAFTVTELQSCRLITLALHNGERTEFDACMAEST